MTDANGTILAKDDIGTIRVRVLHVDKEGHFKFVVIDANNEAVGLKDDLIPTHVCEREDK